MADYTPEEERWNILTHGVGAGLSILALGLLIYRGTTLGDTPTIVGFVVFGMSLIILYTASTLYHSATDPQRRRRLKVFDHVAIYVLIAGTYTPFSLVTLAGSLGTTVLWVVWGCALGGTVLKLFFTGRFRGLSTILYVGMGWIIIFAGRSLGKALAPEGLNWLIAGGVAYTIGALFYSWRKLPFNHAIFHGWVLLGSACHVVAVYGYVGGDY
ncbi:MAG TPA: hemolysin D [Cytophagales bacterium]|nr:hemolysin D [Cytophagales bacterium]HAA21979.1 hemolysin D [Cytophagales bacterium]HAP61323.1 hemolysin D [Cytophagales bacterium]